MSQSQTDEQMIMTTVKFRLNGTSYEKNVPLNMTLLDYLRDGLGYYGTKCGCEIGECGACTVIIDCRVVNSCLVMASQIDGTEIWTIEGVAPAGTGKLHPVQDAFIECDAVHCGFCSPGMIMSVIALLLNNRQPTDAEIKIALAGNLCRCTGYIQIIDAVKKAASVVTDADMAKFSPENY